MNPKMSADASADAIAQNQPMTMATFSPSTTLEQWLLNTLSQGITRLSVEITHNIDNDVANGFGMVMAIHPEGEDGDTIDFLVSANTVRCVTQKFLTLENLDEIKLFKDGDQWCALVGDDLVNGIYAFAPIPSAAVQALANQIKFGLSQ